RPMTAHTRRIIASITSCLVLGACGGATMPSTAIAAQPQAAPSPAGTTGIPFNAHVLVDQFGYRPADSKVAVIRDPRVGFDMTDRFAPGASYQVRNADDGSVAFKGAPARWHDGKVDDSAGDAGWWFDFSALQKEGTYFIYD